MQSEVSKLRTALRDLTEKCRPYLEAIKIAPQKVKEFIGGIVEKFKKQEKSIYYEPLPARKQQAPEREGVTEPLKADNQMEWVRGDK